MQEKVVFDTGVYIDIFNKGLYQHEVDGFSKVMFLAHPVLHELWMGAKGKREIRHLIGFSSTFIRLGRLITPFALYPVIDRKGMPQNEKLRVS